MSALEDLLVLQCRAHGVEEPVREYPFAKELGRRFRFDLAWPTHKLAAECEGGAWSGGRHVRGKGFTEDCVKYSLAAVLGWRVIRATGQQIEDGAAVEWIKWALGQEQAA